MNSFNRINSFKATIAGIGLTALALPAMAATSTTTFQSQIVLTNACATLTATTLDFGSNGVLSASVDQTSTINVTCTTGAVYNVGLNAGANPTIAGDVNTRRMANATNYVSYQMYSNSGRTTVWGDTVLINTVASVGTGAAQAHTVYGRVPAQTTPVAGTYTDTVTVTVTY